MNKKNIDFLIVILFIILFIFLRSINYIYHLNWSGDQASFGIEVMNIIRNKKLTLIGPQISANFQGHYIFQGPAIYYMMLIFMLIGRLDPVWSSYFFMIFASFMIIPIYYGVKKLINEKATWLMLILYTFLPYYINYTRFIWNSTFQLSLLPILILLMGIFKQKKSPKVFFFMAIWLGLLLQFHYQFILIICGIFFYYFFYKKNHPYYLLSFISGIFIGFLPLIIFELKHDFYHLRTIILFIQNWKQVDRPGTITTPHYYLSFSFMFLILLFGICANKIKNISYRHITVLAVILAVYSFIVYLPKPKNAFWAPTTPWNYLDEKRIYDIIRSTKLKNNFNIANLAYYDTQAIVTKYFLKKDFYRIDYEDYYNNSYLFVITQGDNYLGNPAYEIGTFKPKKILKKWKINSKFDMLLLHRP